MLPFNSTLELSDILIWFALIPNSVFLPGKEFNFLYFCGVHTMDLLLKEQDRKHDGGTPRNSGQSLYWGTDHQCNRWNTTSRKLQKCSLLCMLLWSHWVCTVSAMLPAILDQEWTRSLCPLHLSHGLHGIRSLWLVQCIQQTWNTPQIPYWNHTCMF